MPASVSVRASTLARIHTFLSLCAFLGALFVGCTLHYTKIVKNGVAGYPQEWFPSVSATCVSSECGWGATANGTVGLETGTPNAISFSFSLRSTLVRFPLFSPLPQLSSS